MEDLKIAAPNLDVVWKNKQQNFRNIEEKFAAVRADILVLPEMFSTGFYMQAEEIADQKEETLTWMRSFAKEKNIAVCGSASVKENKRFVNRFYFVEPSGEYQYYDKRHLFSYSGEEKTYSPGKERVIVNYKGWRILLQVCYDLRFPVFSRNNGDYDAIFYVANWPSTRIDAWKTLLKARAIENQAYVIGINRIGIDGNNLEYPESSYGFFADGKEISTVENGIFFANLNLENLAKTRAKFPFLSDRDQFEIL